MNDLTTKELMELRWVIEEYVPVKSDLLREALLKIDAQLEKEGYVLELRAFQSEWKISKK
jgi:ribosomal protein S13